MDTRRRRSWFGRVAAVMAPFLTLSIGLTVLTVVLAGPADAASCTTYTSPSGGVKWSSTTSYSAGLFCIQSTVGGGRLVFQNDGNLVLYIGSSNTAVWSSRTSGHGMTFQLHGYNNDWNKDGRLHVFGCTGAGTGCGTNLWESGGNTYNDNYILQIGNDELGGNGKPCIAESSRYGTGAWAQVWTSNGANCFGTVGAG